MVDKNQVKKKICNAYVLNFEILESHWILFWNKFKEFRLPTTMRTMRGLIVGFLQVSSGTFFLII